MNTWEYLVEDIQDVILDLVLGPDVAWETFHACQLVDRAWNAATVRVEARYATHVISFPERDDDKALFLQHVLYVTNHAQLEPKAVQYLPQLVHWQWDLLNCSAALQMVAEKTTWYYGTSFMHNRALDKRHVGKTSLAGNIWLRDLIETAIYRKPEEIWKHIVRVLH